MFSTYLKGKFACNIHKKQKQTLTQKALQKICIEIYNSNHIFIIIVVIGLAMKISIFKIMLPYYTVSLIAKFVVTIKLNLHIDVCENYLQQ